MRKRMDVMHDVARTKWNAQRAIRDPERERVLLDEVVQRAQSHQLDGDFARAFFAAQIEAATLIQEADFQEWRTNKQPPFADAPSLAELRQRIDSLNTELLSALAQARPFLQTNEGQELLRDRVSGVFADYPAAVRDAAVRPLKHP